MTRWMASFFAMALVAACSTTPSPVAQQRICGRLSQDLCAQVIGVVQASVPESKSSRLAIADYATPGGVPATGPLGGPISYLVAFAPWAAATPPGSPSHYISPPTWLVANADGQWSLAPRPDVTALNVCFIELLGAAGLTDYGPPHPSGVCGP